MHACVHEEEEELLLDVCRRLVVGMYHAVRQRMYLHARQTGCAGRLAKIAPTGKYMMAT